MLRGRALASSCMRKASSSRLAAPSALCAPVPVQRLANFAPFTPASVVQGRAQHRWVASRAAAVEVASAPPRGEVFTQDPSNNVTEYIYEKMGKNLHLRPAHPLGIIKQLWTEGGKSVPVLSSPASPTDSVQGPLRPQWSTQQGQSLRLLWCTALSAPCRLSTTTLTPSTLESSRSSMTCTPS